MPIKQAYEYSSIAHAPGKVAGHSSGIADALCIVAQFGFSVNVESDTARNSPEVAEKSLVNTLQQGVEAQRVNANLRVELHEREENAKVAHFLHADELEHKAKALEGSITTLSAVLLNKDRLVARLQMPQSGSYMAVELQHQKVFSELVMAAARDSCSVTKAREDVQWVDQQLDKSSSLCLEVTRALTAAEAASALYHVSLAGLSDTMAELQLSFESEAGQVNLTSHRAISNSKENASIHDPDALLFQTPAGLSIQDANSWR